jgi:outer membrane protein assembly factor BamD (BamD/ComL family)
MSVSAISTSNLMQYNTQNTQNTQNSAQLFRQEFQQLGQDLQSGNLSAAKQDYTSLQQGAENYQAHKHGHGHRHGDYNQSNEVAQLFQQLGQDLQSGNASAAQSAYSSIQQEFAALSASNGSLATPLTSQTSSNGVSATA